MDLAIVLRHLMQGITVSLLWSLYDAWVKGEDVRSLDISLLKYTAVSIVVLHWNSVFTDIVNCFDSVSYQIGFVP